MNLVFLAQAVWGERTSLASLQPVGPDGNSKPRASSPGLDSERPLASSNEEHFISILIPGPGAVGGKWSVGVVQHPCDGFVLKMAHSE